ncbi:EAL domain-containing protein [uncultured Jannaschia sp.]|uniref:putative bifunctional diguanylate cyclase/phosphodiesterase n=1 Tax=uncultured Jannaschia sp. TaxID=293347 RepID=UPI0026158A89|nr:EAL domain-containing protein [uncultured Jannaschia sp.]
MSIRLKLVVGCLSLTLMMAGIGLYLQRSQQDIGALATRIYDEALMSVSYLRSAQNGLMELLVANARVGREIDGTTASEARRDMHARIEAALPTILSDLEIARERVMSPMAVSALESLYARIEDLGADEVALTMSELNAELVRLQEEFDVAVEVFAGDGYVFRRDVQDLIDRSMQRAWIAISFSVLGALVVSYLLSRSIVPAMRKAVGIATSIAAGKIDNQIESRGRGETGELLRALSTMQASIAASLARIRALMDAQASNHASEIRVQHNRFEAALNNMSQGLSLFDASGRLQVYNRRFAEMFGAPEIGITDEAVAIPDALKLRPVSGENAQFSTELEDGRVVAVSYQAIAGGGWVTTYEDVTQQRQVEMRLAYLAKHDALTGLPNRSYFREHLEDHLFARAPGKAVAVHCLDLDGFKMVNDTLGHPVGDALLEAVAGRLSNSIRGADMVARLGGDEFAIIQADVDSADEIERFAQRLLRRLGTPFKIDEHEISIGVSIGISSSCALVDEEHVEDAETLVKNADLALYRAKDEGRNTYRFFEPGMDERLRERLSLELDLRAALDKREFELFYQPLVDTADDSRICGFEALLRWSHPVRGPVSPAVFIPLAESLGLIAAIGEWVLKEACAQAARWPEDVSVAVNLSAIQFRDSDLVAIVQRTLGESGLDADRLELEITESVLLQNPDGVLQTLHDLQNLGVRISMDDFGTGYSSLSYLQSFPFDKIKIDRSFIRDLPTSRNCAAIVRAIITLGQSLEIVVLAEGVETEEQLVALQRENCWNIQGFLFGRPEPAAEALVSLRTRSKDGTIMLRSA